MSEKLQSRLKLFLPTTKRTSEKTFWLRRELEFLGPFSELISRPEISLVKATANKRPMLGLPSTSWLLSTAYISDVRLRHYNGLIIHSFIMSI
jgi:hypothetical protein